VNPTPAEVISTEAVPIDNAILLHSMTSEVGLEEPEIGCTDTHIPRANNCMHDELHFGMPGGCKDYNNISKMYFSLWKPPEVSERMWSVNLDVSISGEYQTVGGHSGRPSE
jgi:hypothetical protein